MPLSPFLASSRQPPVAASCSCCQPCSHGRHAGNIDCKTSRCSSTVRRVHSCERGSNEIPLQLLSIQLCQIYESIFLMLFSCHLWDFTDMPKQAMQISKLWSWSLTEMLMMTGAHDDDDDDDDDDKPIPEGMRSRCMVHH